MTREQVNTASSKIDVALSQGSARLDRSLADISRRLSQIAASIAATLTLGAGGTIAPTAANYGRLLDIEREYDREIRRRALPAFMGTLRQELGGITRATVSYFTLFLASEAVLKASEVIYQRLAGILGLGADDTLTPGSPASLVLENDAPLDSVKRIIAEAITTSVTPDVLQDALATAILERDIMAKHVYGYIPQPLDRFQRETSTKFAEEFSLRYAIYQGGLIETSRPFCEVRNDKVFSRDEVAKFGTVDDKYGGYTVKPEFKGKPPIYDPFRDLGGYNCRHHLDWISDELASELLVEEARARTDQTEVEKLSDLASRGIDTNEYYKVNGEFTPERQALHDKIVNDILAKETFKGDPVVYMTGGAPANGKSTFAESEFSNIPKDILEINADLIKELLPEYNLLRDAGDMRSAAFVHEESSYLSRRILLRAVAEGRPLFIDALGDGSLEDMIGKAFIYRSRGHKIIANYVTLDTELSMRLLKERAAKTGRLVPESYTRAMNREIPRMLDRYIDAGVFDELRLWDTNERGLARLVMEYRNGTRTIIRPDLYQRFLDKARDR